MIIANGRACVNTRADALLYTFLDIKKTMEEDNFFLNFGGKKKERKFRVNILQRN